MATLRVVKTPPPEMAHRAFLEAGYRIFPLWRFRDTGKDLFCECENPKCVASGKHPRASNWQHTPEWDEEQVDTMEQMGHLSGGYGVLCKGLLVIDVDARNGGIASYTKLLADFPEIAGCGFAVTTGSGGGSRHLYFSLPEIIPMVSSLPEYPGIDFKTSGFVVGPGSMHASGNRYTTDGDPSDIEPAPESIIARLRKPERHRTEYNGTSVDVSHGDIASMLDAIPNNDLSYDEWLNIGMAIHQATNGTGEALWEEWSAKSHKHDERQMAYKWHSFGRSANPVTIGTLIFHAEQNGWKMPVTFSSEDIAALVAHDEPEAVSDGLPFDISGVNLSSPPGFVGEVAKWIESQSRRPRVTLSVAAALTAIGNVAGLRYTDDKDKATTNLFAFCIAGSRTGKESIQQAVATIHRHVGLSPATHGNIKSEQEIIKNLIRHQAALYVVDEIGILLNKIKNAQTRGGAVYLEGVIGAIMAAYGKANGFMLISGDVRDEVRKVLLQELSQLTRKAEEGAATPAITARLSSLQYAIDTLDNGLEKPFLSIIGFTTPETFNGMVDTYNATNGFIGRSLLFNERDTAPLSKENYNPQELPEAMGHTLAMMATGGDYDMMAMRVEHYGERVVIPTDPRASSMLKDVSRWLDRQGVEHKGLTGLEALYIGAYELVTKISLILAVPEGLRTAEHVRWAFALIKRDVEEKCRLVIGNDRAKDSPAMALAAKIANIASGDDGETIGVIHNRMRQYRKEDINAAIAALEKAGRIKRVETIHPTNKKVISRLVYRE